MHTNQHPMPDGVRGRRLARGERTRVLMGMSGLCLVLGLAGCVTTSAPRPEGESPSNETNVVAALPPIQPLDGAVGRVVRVQADLRFVVVDYSLNRVPEPDRLLAVYRGGEVVGRLKAGRFRRDTTVVADIVSGTAVEGDEVRDE